MLSDYDIAHLKVGDMLYSTRTAVPLARRVMHIVRGANNIVRITIQRNNPESERKEVMTLERKHLSGWSPTFARAIMEHNGP